jgi:hypothetical protein
MVEPPSLAAEDRAAAETLRNAIQVDDRGGHYTSTAFDELLTAMTIARAQGAQPRVHAGHLVSAHDELWYALTAIQKVAWFAELWNSGDLPDNIWMFFASSDIVGFHIMLRSLMDEAGAVAASVGDNPGSIPDRFAKLQTWLGKPGNDARLGPDLTETIRRCTWFEALRNVRDDILHRGGQALVMLERPHVLFQVHVGLDNRIIVPAVMHNENVVDFPRYAALVLARLHVFLEALAEAVSARDGAHTGSGGLGTKDYHPGLATLRAWLDLLLGEPDG